MIVLRKIALILLVLFIFIVPVEKVVLIEGLGSIAKVFGIFAMMAWFLAFALGGGLRSTTPFHTYLFLFILWNCASIFWSVDIDATQVQVITWVQLGLLMILIWDLLDKKTLVTIGVQAYVLGALLGAIGIIYNFLGTTDYVYGRYSAAGQHPVNIGLILAIAVPMSWYLVLQRVGSSKITTLLLLLNITYIPVGCIGIALTGSRGAMVAALPAILFILPTLGILPLWAKLLAALAAIGGIYSGYQLIPEESIERLSTAYTELTGGGTLTGRTQIWADAFNRFMDNPILGLGSDAFKAVSQSGLVAHNSFLSVLVETGIVGLLLFLAIVITAFIYCFQLPKLESRLWKTVLLIWFLGASATTYEFHKPTWLIFAFIVSSRFERPIREPLIEPPIVMKRV